MEHYLRGSRIQSNANKDHAYVNKQKSLNSTFNESSQTNSSCNFDCNICLDLVQEPVVTFCGHLYCWPCIYKWISCGNTSAEYADTDQTKCPVCKAEVSEKTLVPLYGRGRNESKDKEDSLIIPQRPRCDDTMPRRNYVQHYNNAGSDDLASPMIRLGGTTTSHLVDPMIGMFGEMVYARFFGNSESTLYSNPNYYRLEGTSSRRLRRYIMEADKSLSRMCFFLCCCVVLCLLLF